MGQCYWVYNESKNIIIDYQGFLKLTEHSWLGMDLVNYLRKLLSTDWKGDKIYHLGEYVTKNNWSSLTKNSAFLIINEAKKITCCMSENDESYKFPYVINKTKKLYFDIRKSAIDDWEPYKGSFHFISLDPLLLLLACGNDDSCGDYRGVNANLLGSWARDEIECSESSPHQGIRKTRYIFLSENDNEEDNYHYL